MRYFFCKDGFKPIKTKSRALFEQHMVEDQINAVIRSKHFPKEDFEQLLDHPNLVVLYDNAAELAKAHNIYFATTSVYLDDHPDTLDMMAEKGYSLVLRHIRADNSTNQPRYIADFYMFDSKVFNALVRPHLIDAFLKDNK